MPTVFGGSLSDTRYRHLLRELSVAIENTSQYDLRQWGRQSGRMLVRVTWRRGKGLGRVVYRVINVVAGEGVGLLDAGLKGRTKAYLRQRGDELKGSAIETAETVAHVVRVLARNLAERPKETAPRIAAGVLGFLTGSGGIDGDGGIPDLDLLGGPGAHRSLFTHSIIAGIICEVSVHALLSLVRMAHSNLPQPHDPVWDGIKASGEDLASALSLGLSTGISYHLAFDATVDGDGVYRNIPVSMPIEGHQLLAGANAATEAIDAVQRGKLERVYKSFSEAAEVAREFPGYAVKRAQMGKGYRVVPAEWTRTK